jgi:hypothetical protein
VLRLARPADDGRLSGAGAGRDARAARDPGADVAPGTEGLDGIDRFDWVTDLEDSRVELWQPA